MDSEVHRDGAGAGTHVGDYNLPAFHAHERHEQRVFDHGFGLRAGDQHVPVHQEVDAVELAVVEDIGQRLPRESPRHDGGQLFLLLRRDLGLLLGEDGLPRHAHHVHHHHLRLQPGVRYLCRLEGAVGLLDDGAQVGHIGQRQGRPCGRP